MTARRWPILDLDDGATETEVRRAYAKRLREQGTDADVASFQALRAEFDDALAAARGGSTVRVAVHTSSPADAIAEITRYLEAGELVRACDRFDRAREESELDVSASATLERELARAWLADTTLDPATLTRIAERYRWTDVVSDFPLGTEIVARLHASPVAHAAPVSVRPPGERFIGQWNWGAFLLTPFWLMAHGLRNQGIGFLALGVMALIVPYGMVAVVIAAAVYGRRGTLLAVRNRRFSDEAHFVAVQNEWRNVGIAVVTGCGFCFALAVAWMVRTFP